MRKFRNLCRIKRLLLLTLVMAGCGINNSKPSSETTTTTATADSLHKPHLLLKESINQEDTIDITQTADSLLPIRENFKRINSITRWTHIDTIELSESGEGGSARFYFSDQQLQKIIAQQFGETFQQLTEYYLLNGKLSFVFEKTLRYNRPIYYDSVAMKASGDTAAFDLAKSTILESRNYFQHQKLVQQLENLPNTVSPEKQDLLIEEERIQQAFKTLIHLHKSE